MIDRWLDSLSRRQLFVVFVATGLLAGLLGSLMFFCITFNLALSIICGFGCVAGSMFVNVVRLCIRAMHR